MVDKQVRITVRVQPGAGKDELVYYRDNVLKIRVKAPPEKGKANEAVISYLGKITGLPKSSIGIIKGATSRNKLIFIEGIDQNGLANTVMPLLSKK
jgi:uncharacterized protein (TIGR00251 family)